MAPTKVLRTLLLLLPLTALALSGCLGEDDAPSAAPAQGDDTAPEGGDDRLAGLYASHQDRTLDDLRPKACSEHTTFTWTLGTDPHVDGTDTFPVPVGTDRLRIEFTGARGVAFYAASYDTMLTDPAGTTLLHKTRVFTAGANPEGTSVDSYSGTIAAPTPGTYTFTWDATGYIDRMDLTVLTMACS